MSRRVVSLGFWSNAVLCAGGLYFSALGFAAPSAKFSGEVNYSVPVKQNDLKPFSTFFVSRFSVFQDEDDKTFRLNLTLPRDLVGGKNVEVQLTETGREGTKIKFTKDIGDAVCEVPADWNTAKCVYKFNDKLKEKFTEQEADSYLSQKYKGDVNLAKRKTVAIGIFRNTESIGEANLKSFDASCAACQVGNGVWTSDYTTADGTRIDAELEFTRTTGHYFNDSGFGNLSNIQYQGNTATGVWTYGNSKGWFQFLFDPDSETFSGNWGMGGLGTDVKGTWSGSRLQD
jgi:hypothetical protein